VERVTDPFELPPAPPVSNKTLVQIIRGGNESTIAFEENGDRSLEEEPSTPRLAAQRSRPKPTTRPQSLQPPNKSDKANETETEKEKEKDGVGGEPRTASGASPGEPAPRADQVKGALRKGM
jgi:hypothetical protein